MKAHKLKAKACKWKSKASQEKEWRAVTSALRFCCYYMGSVQFFFLVLGVFIFCLHASLHYLNVFLYLCVFFLVCIVSLMYHKRHIVHQLSFNITGIICLWCSEWGVVCNNYSIDNNNININSDNEKKGRDSCWTDQWSAQSWKVLYCQLISFRISRFKIYQFCNFIATFNN